MGLMQGDHLWEEGLSSDSQPGHPHGSVMTMTKRMLRGFDLRQRGDHSWETWESTNVRFSR